MRYALPLIAALALFGCRPLDVGAPIADGPDPTLADGGEPGEPGTPAVPIRIIDGDTFVMGGETVRISNIDAPEMPPRAKCPEEAAGAERATAALVRFLHLDLGARPYLAREGRDRYGRTLARVYTMGTVDVGDRMISEGFARPWTGRRESWCDLPDFSARARPAS